MTDKELLELAARAAGIEHGVDRADSGLSLTNRDGRHTYFPKWNPLTDDGDAFRLAVELGIRIDMESDVCVSAYKYVNSAQRFFISKESSRENRLENARRAICNVAANIGSAMA